MNNRHPAHEIPFPDLYAGLQLEVLQGNVRKVSGPKGLELFCYTEQCVYNKAWNTFSLCARGLVVEPEKEKIAATPFTKFFNVGEHEVKNIPDLPFKTYEKVDGSLIIVFENGGEWMCCTKGSFTSSQALWAKQQLLGKVHNLCPSVTYLFEAVYAENRIVVHYPYEGLVLLGAYDSFGYEIAFDHLVPVADLLRIRSAKVFSYGSVSELLSIATTLPSTSEGFVMKFMNGLRLKVKGDEYCRIHRMVSRITPLAMWEAMAAGDDLDAIRRQLPEEFWFDFDSIISLLSRKVNNLIEQVYLTVKNGKINELSDKELGLRILEFPETVRGFLFPWRKHKGALLDGKCRKKVFDAVRPTGNVLEGYTPSSAFKNVVEEAS